MRCHVEAPEGCGSGMKSCVPPLNSSFQHLPTTSASESNGRTVRSPNVPPGAPIRVEEVRIRAAARTNIPGFRAHSERDRHPEDPFQGSSGRPRQNRSGCARFLRPNQGQTEASERASYPLSKRMDDQGWALCPPEPGQSGGCGWAPGVQPPLVSACLGIGGSSPALGGARLARSRPAKEHRKHSKG